MISVSPSGITTDVIDEYRSGKISFIVLTCVGTVTPVRFLSPLKALFPICSSDNGNLTDIRRQHP